MTRTLPAALAALTLLALLPGRAHAGASHRSAGSTGIGLGGGTASGGISAKRFLTGATAIQGVIGTYGRWGDGTGLGLSADYLLERPPLASGAVADLAWNIGAGAGVGLFPATDTLAAGVSGVAGLELAFVPIPLDFVVEYRPTVGVLPGVGLDLVNFTGHLRWFF